MIEIKELCKEYILGKNKVSVLNSFNLNIEDGEFVGIIGRSGSGKSTLSNIIAGLLKPTSGEIIVDGVSIWNLNDREISRYRNKTLGFVFQSFNLIPSLTALENVMLPLAYSGIKHKKRIEMAKNALKTVGLSDRIHHKPGELSGGQMQRVSIARAIINSPSIIIADEPTGNLDVKSAETVMNLIKDINRKGVTVIMVTHNNEYIGCFDKVVNMV